MMGRIAGRLAALLAMGALLGAAPAPVHYRLMLMDGTSVTGEQLRGKVVVLNFWASWCVPCREELPLLDRFQAAHAGEGLVIYAVGTEPMLPPSRVRAIFGRMRLPVARGATGPFELIGGLPTTYVIDRAGRVRHAEGGAFTDATLRSAVAPLLRER